MKERPILFSGAMVRAIRAGTKTQTRRVIKDQAIGDKYCETLGDGRVLLEWLGTPCCGSGVWDVPEYSSKIASPYGVIGDRLWVREAWRAPAEFNNIKPSELRAPHDGLLGTPIIYEASRHDSVQFGKLRPSMFMPRWASRITLGITGVRVERLQDISEADALAEGVYDGRACQCEDPLDMVRQCGACGGRLVDARGLFTTLWESINGPDSWAANPWVWVVEFQSIESGAQQ